MLFLKAKSDTKHPQMAVCGCFGHHFVCAEGLDSFPS